MPSVTVHFDSFQDTALKSGQTVIFVAQRPIQRALKLTFAVPYCTGDYEPRLTGSYGYRKGLCVLGILAYAVLSLGPCEQHVSPLTRKT